MGMKKKQAKIQIGQRWELLSPKEEDTSLLGLSTITCMMLTLLNTDLSAFHRKGQCEIILPNTTGTVVPHSPATTKLRAKYDPMASFFYPPNTDHLYTEKTARRFFQLLLSNLLITIFIPPHNNEYNALPRKKKCLIRSWATRIPILNVLYACFLSMECGNNYLKCTKFFCKVQMKTLKNTKYKCKAVSV